ncbi:peptidylprolyl isomerase [Sulfitobacter sp. D35]|uniref:peptidylprolyl isomerase n=1 Tax=Sulfitobacter sp. D35 TaxID=3083252 RepID=UPI00296FC210|nr:peptidylprolyl isomerase [Sulfitobacter sp. D35]MDW4500329.1 peptidylprolyl isomerase [Sulfitobacter sp. D35]
MTPRTILTSPLIHFFVLGGMIFALYALLDDGVPEMSEDQITLTQSDAARIAEQFRGTWNRPPTGEELEQLMQARVLEEALAREAMALGLDRDDAVIRQRLTTKMQFLAEATVASIEPSDDALQTYLDANAEVFRTPESVAFQQVVLPIDDPAGQDDIRDALANGADPASVGVASMLPARLPLSPVPLVVRTFGAGFAEALAALPVGEWQGPVQSSYGLHVVKVTEREAAVLPTLEQIRDRVETEWRADRMREAREAFGAALLDRYAITLPKVDTVLSQ